MTGAGAPLVGAAWLTARDFFLDSLKRQIINNIKPTQTRKMITAVKLMPWSTSQVQTFIACTEEPAAACWIASILALYLRSLSGLGLPRRLVPGFLAGRTRFGFAVA